MAAGRTLSTLVVGATLLLAPLTPAVGGPAPDVLRVSVSPFPGERVSWTLTCHPTGGTHPNAARSCTTLDAMPDAFAALPTGVMCSMIYSGPQTARVTGMWDGRPVDTTFARNDGCATARWNHYRALFTDPRDVTVTGRVDLAPTCPVQQVGQDCMTKGAPATVTATSRGRTRQVPAGASGFTTRLPPRCLAADG